MGSFSKNFALLSLGFWLGCAVLFAAVIAPTLFNPDVTTGISQNMRGSIVGAVLRQIYLITYITVGLASFFLLLSTFGESKGAKGPRRALILCFLILGLNAASDRWILDHINKVKLKINNAATETEAAGHKKEFDQWHKASTILYGSATGCGLLAALFLLPSTAATGKPKKGK